MPPEQFGGKTVPVSDLYSLRATLIYLATEKHPTDLPSKNGRILFADLVNLDPNLIAWIGKMTDPSQDRRLSFATQALQALKHPINLAKELIITEVVKQPRKSKILLHKTSEAIEILAPPQGFCAEVIYLITFACFWNGFVAVWTGTALFMSPFPINIFFALFSIPFWAAGLALTAKIMLLLLVNTRLKINSQEISLTYEWGKFKYQKPKPSPKNTITNVKSENSDYLFSVVIRANEEAYKVNGTINPKNSLMYNYLNNEISKIELNWLKKEIESWLEQG